MKSMADLTQDKMAFADAEGGFEISGHTPLRLDAQDGCWIVRQGAVEVSYARAEDGSQTGRRMRLCTAGPGEALFGMSRGDVASRIMLLATGMPGTKLSRVEPDWIASRPGLGARLAEQWVASFLQGILGHALKPKDCALAEDLAGGELPQGTAVSTQSKAALFRVDRGGAFLLGDRTLPLLGPGDVFPLSPDFWVEAGEGLSISPVCPDAKTLGANPLRDCRGLVFAVLGALVDKETVTESQRLAAKMDQTARALDNGLRSFLLDAREGSGGLPHDASDPLFAACRMVCAAMGIDMAMPATAVASQTRRHPLLEIARVSRIRIRPVHLSEGWWRKNNGPLLAFEDESGRPMALLQDTPVSYRLMDPLTGQGTAVDEAVASRLHHMAYMFYRPFPVKPLGVWSLLAFGARGSWRDGIQIMVLGLAGGFLTLAFPLLTATVFDRVIPMAQSRQLLQVGAALLVCAVATALFDLTRAIGFMRLEGSMNASIQGAVMDRLLSLPTGLFRRYPVGDLADRALGVNTMAETLTGSVAGALLSSVFSVFNIAVLLSFDSRLGLAALGMVALAAAATAGFIALGVRHQKAVVEQSGAIAGKVFQFISGIAKLKVAGAESKAFVNWMGSYRGRSEHKYRSSLVAAHLSAFNALYPVIFTMVIFAMVAARPESLKLGEMLAFVAAFSQLLAAGLLFSSALTSLLPVMPIYERSRPIFETLPEVDPARSDPGELSGNIEMRGVSFRYITDGPMVLQDVSFELRHGEFVAVVGPSGCGKSTLLRLLLGFETPGAGSIYYDSQNLQGIDVQAVRSQIGVVLQNGDVMSGDIFRNIVGSHNLTLDDAWEAARKAGLATDIEAMPMGMFTAIPSGGSVLSGGQRQRLLIARAMVTKPRIFFFDEATSALDNITQAVISKSLKEFNSTRLVIAHRLSTVMEADTILVMDGGRIVERGRYEELMEANGLFSTLARRQLI